MVFMEEVLLLTRWRKHFQPYGTFGRGRSEHAVEQSIVIHEYDGSTYVLIMHILLLHAQLSTVD